MKLTTIWTLPAMSLGERLMRTGDLAMQEIARRLPKRIRYWVFIQVGVQATKPHEVVTEMLYVDVLQRAEGGPR